MFALTEGLYAISDALHRVADVLGKSSQQEERQEATLTVPDTAEPVTASATDPSEEPAPAEESVP